MRDKWITENRLRAMNFVFGLLMTLARTFEIIFELVEQEVVFCDLAVLFELE